MAKKPNAIYDPGELDRVRGKLGDIDHQEAKRMAQILGGEVGVEKSAGRTRHETVELVLPGSKKKPSGRRVEVLGDTEDQDSGINLAALKSMKGNPLDDPQVVLKTPYLERVKMDRYATQFDFEIKNSMQLFVSVLSFFHEPTDYVNPRFVSRRMNIYYSKIEQLVTSTRGLFPRHNARRSERLKKSSPFLFAVLDTIRYWNIERIGADLAKIQAHPRVARVSEFADILRDIYRPLFILERLDLDPHIKSAYKLLYKVLHVENPSEPKEKNQEHIRTALSAFAEIRREIRYGMYPLLMKFISDRWLPYELLFVDRRNRYMAFIGASEAEQLDPAVLAAELQANKGNPEALQADVESEPEEQGESSGVPEPEVAPEDEDPNDPEVIERKEREAVAEAEKRVVDHSLSIMESLFPQAGWEKLDEYPDMYPYFAGIYELRHGYELISPSDSLLQIAVLMHIMENLCVGLRYVTFGEIAGPDGNALNINDVIGEIITNWRQTLDNSFKEYLPRLADYCRMIEHSVEAKNSVYARRTLNEIRWLRRLYYLPFYKFASLGPPPFQNLENSAIYSQIRTLRKNLTMVATGIEQGTRSGGAAAKARCPGIDNPWAPYHFEIPNAVSKRLDVLFGAGKRTNAVLVFYTLAVATVLDNLLNSENSWAYDDNDKIVFRSVKNEGIVPMFGVDTKIDADQIFKNAVIKRRAEGRQHS